MPYAQHEIEIGSRSHVSGRLVRLSFSLNSGEHMRVDSTDCRWDGIINQTFRVKYQCVYLLKNIFQIEQSRRPFFKYLFGCLSTIPIGLRSQGARMILKVVHSYLQLDMAGLNMNWCYPILTSINQMWICLINVENLMKWTSNYRRPLN